MSRSQEYVKDRAVGCLMGMLAGDDNGGPTAMMMKNLKTIAHTKTLMTQYFGKGYLEWFKKDGYDAGLVTHKVLNLVSLGLSFGEAAKQVNEVLEGMTAGISPAHRSIPLTLYYVAWYLRSPNFFEEFPNTGFREFESSIKSEAKLTHLNKEAGEVSAAVNAICLYFIVGKDEYKAIKFGMKFLNYDWAWQDNIFKHIGSLTIDDLNNGGYAPDALVAALWFLFNNRTFEDAIKQSKEFAGAANYCPVLVGLIGGSMYGYKEIKPFLKNISKDNLEEVTSSISSIFNDVGKARLDKWKL